MRCITWCCYRRLKSGNHSLLIDKSTAYIRSSADSRRWRIKRSYFEITIINSTPTPIDMNHILGIIAIKNKFVPNIFGCTIIKYRSAFTNFLLNQVHPLLRSKILTIYISKIFIISEIVNQSLSYLKGISTGTRRRILHFNWNTTCIH